MAETGVKVVMFSTSNIASYACIAADINQAYCATHAYRFRHYQYDSVVLGPAYEKVRILQREIAGAKFLLWMDSDAVFINFRESLSEFCELDKDIVIAGHEFGFDGSGEHVPWEIDGTPAGLNTGFILVRSSLWTRLFLDQWWRRCVLGFRSGIAYAEQGVLQQMLMENVMQMQSHTHLVTPCSRFNRSVDTGADVCDFILHLWGLGDQPRSELLTQVHCGQRPSAGISMPYFFVPDLRFRGAQATH